MSGNGHGAHGASDDHDHPHPPANTLSHHAKRVYAMRELLIEKGVLMAEAIQEQVNFIESRSPANGARLVARAWVDPAFKARLLADPKVACAEMGIDARGLVEFVVLENTPSVRHLVVCTLCSCYPRAILGRPPDWYKSLNYRSRAVSEPRAVIAEWGEAVPDDVEVRVFDSTADMRYFVLPLRPAGTEHLSEVELAALVTRDSLLGVETPRYQPVAAR